MFLSKVHLPIRNALISNGSCCCFMGGTCAPIPSRASTAGATRFSCHSLRCLTVSLPAGFSHRAELSWFRDSRGPKPACVLRKPESDHVYNRGDIGIPCSLMYRDCRADSWCAHRPHIFVSRICRCRN